MKYLQDYIEEKQTNLFEKYGVFFAFGNEQFKKGCDKVGATENNKVMSFGAGMYGLSKNKDAIVNGLETIHSEGMAEDVKENGKDAIILRELRNHECFYTYDIQDAVRKVKPYGFTELEVAEIFRKNLQTE